MNPASALIAVVDDESGMRTALGRLLSSHGFEVVLHADGAALLRSLERRPPDCIILDLHMVGLNGFGVMEQLHRRGDSPPVIAVTGFDEPGHLPRLRRLGVRHYLLKPLDERPLLAAIHSCVS